MRTVFWVLFGNTSQGHNYLFLIQQMLKEKKLLSFLSIFKHLRVIIGIINAYINILYDLLA